MCISLFLLGGGSLVLPKCPCRHRRPTNHLRAVRLCPSHCFSNHHSVPWQTTFRKLQHQLRVCHFALKMPLRSPNGVFSSVSAKKGLHSSMLQAAEATGGRWEELCENGSRDFDSPDFRGFSSSFFPLLPLSCHRVGRPELCYGLPLRQCQKFCCTLAPVPHMNRHHVSRTKHQESSTKSVPHCPVQEHRPLPLCMLVPVPVGCPCACLHLCRCVCPYLGAVGSGYHPGYAVTCQSPTPSKKKLSGYLAASPDACWYLNAPLDPSSCIPHIIQSTSHPRLTSHRLLWALSPSSSRFVAVSGCGYHL